MERTYVRLVFVVLVSSLLFTVGVVAVQNLDSAPSESELSRQANQPLSDRTQLVPPANGVTVVTSQSGSVSVSIR